MGDDVPRNATGVPVDPVDGDPVFTYVDGVPYSLQRWRKSAPDRRAETVADLEAIAQQHRTKEK